MRFAGAIIIAACLALPTISTAQKSDLERKLLLARDAGRRAGEAAGAAIVCYGLRITDKVTELRNRYQGGDLAEFDDQAGKVLQAWQATKTCQNAGGPNECKVSQQWSCLQALQEIGPGGSTLPGLVEPK